MRASSHATRSAASSVVAPDQPVVRPGLRRRQLRCLVQDRGVQRPATWARLNPHRGDERGARDAVGLQRVGLAAAAVQREHQLAVQSLAERMVGHEPGELTDDVAVAAGQQLLVDRRLDRAEPELLESADLGGGERLVGHVGKGRAPPQRQALARGALLDEALEALHVDVIDLDAQLIAPPAGDDRAVAVAHHQPSQLGDVALDELRRARRRLLAPQALHEPVGGHRLVRAEREHRQHAALLGGGDRCRVAADLELHGSEETNLHVNATLNRRRARDKPREPARHTPPRNRALPAVSDDGAMTSIGKRLPVALTALCLTLSAAPASATTVASHLPARGTDVAARDQQAPRALTHLPALGTDVAAVDQQVRVASARASGATPSG